MFNGLVYDATPMLFPQCGVGRVTKTLWEHLIEAYADMPMKLYARRLKGPSLKKILPGKKGQHWRLPYKAENFMKRLGVIDHCMSAELYHATDHYLPLRHPEKALVTIHDTIFWSCPEKGWYIQADMAKRLPEFLRRCRGIITCSEFSKQEILRHVNGVDESNITVIPWGIDHSVFHHRDDERGDQEVVARLIPQLHGRPYFFSISCSTGRKNTQMLLDCYERVLDQHVKHDLVLVWNAPQEIRDRIRHSKINGRVHLISGIDDGILASLYRQATVTVYPTHWEGFGLPVLESMACGTPVICDQHSSLKEVCGGLQLPIKSHQPHTLYRMMGAVDHGEVFLCDYSRLGQGWAKRFTWENCATQTMELYRKTIAGGC